jgi:membrane associated rhomboid family serine protease
MFIFPLGLQAKTKDFPWMSVAILVVTTVYSVLTFDAMDTFRQATTTGAEALERVKTEKTLLLSTCPDVGFSRLECDILAHELRPESPETERQVVARISTSPDFILGKSGRRELAKYFYQPAKLKTATKPHHTLPEYVAFDEALRTELHATTQTARDQKILTRSSFGALSLLRSLGLHAGWVHLLGNMAFFLMFAIPLESRIGSLALLLIYFIGGSAGMTLDLFMSNDSTRPLLGASAAVSAVAAAFMVAFWSLSVRVFVSLFLVFNQIVLIPTWLFFALFVLVNDLTGTLSLQADGVAHVAHLGGFAIGALLGAIAALVVYLPKPFAFPFELKLLIESRKSKSLDTRLSHLHQILFHNPYNSVALLECWRVLKLQSELSWPTLTKDTRSFIILHFTDLLLELKSGDKNELRDFITRTVSSGWPWATLLKQSELSRVVGLANELYGKKRGSEVEGLAQILLRAFPNSDEAQALRFLEKRFENTEAALPLRTTA